MQLLPTELHLHLILYADYTVRRKCLTGEILTNLTNQSFIVKIFPINILHFNKII